MSKKLDLQSYYSKPAKFRCWITLKYMRIMISVTQSRNAATRTDLSYYSDVSWWSKVTIFQRKWQRDSTFSTVTLEQDKPHTEILLRQNYNRFNRRTYRVREFTRHTKRYAFYLWIIDYYKNKKFVKIINH